MRYVSGLSLTSSVVLFCVVVSPAMADPTPGTAAIPPAEQKTLEQFGRETAACNEWSDGCAVCVRHGDTSACGLPGIACQPGAPACRDAQAKP